MIAFMGTELNESGILFYVNQGEKTIWSKHVSWLRSQKERDAAKHRQEKIAADLLAESVRLDIIRLRRAGQIKKGQ